MKPILLIAFLSMAVNAVVADPPASSVAAAVEPSGGLANCIVLIGNIAKPKTVRYEPGFTITQALSGTGGFAEFGALPIYIIRNGAVKFRTSTADLRKVGKSGKPKTEDIRLLPWDIVCVGEITVH